MEKADLYTRITNRIIAELEAGTRPWLKPWNAEHAAGRITRPLRHNGIPYRGINVVTLWMTATARGYACPIWLTYKQAQELGAQVRKGEHGELVVYANRITRTETAATGEETEREIPFLKGYTVFNAEQIDNLPLHFTAPAAPTLDPVQRIAHAESFLDRTAAFLDCLRRGEPIEAPVALVVAHPDDETLSAGASLALFRHLTLVHVPDGAPRSLHDAQAAGFRTTRDYAAARMWELCQALDAAGAAVEPVFLGIPDQQASLFVPEVATALRGLLAGAALVITHAYEGGHPDHDACAAAVHGVAARFAQNRTLTRYADRHCLSPRFWKGVLKEKSLGLAV